MTYRFGAREIVTTVTTSISSGVCWNMYWEEVILKCFDGERLVIPAVHPSVDMLS